MGTIPLIAKPWNFNHSSIPDLSQKVAVVTGANTGLGESTAKYLALNGATTIMCCRTESKCLEAANKIKKIQPNVKVHPYALDLASLKSVRDFATKIKQDFPNLDILVLNAGVMIPPYELTEENLELQFGVNHVAHFYLTQLLLPSISEHDGRIVVVSSNAHFMSYPEGIRLDLDSLNDPAKYVPMQAYGQSKLANVLFTQELAERLKDKDIYVNTLNPGGVSTELQRHALDKGRSYFGDSPVKFGEYLVSLIFWTPDDACLTQLYAATSPEIKEKNIRGRYFAPIAQLCDTTDHAKNKTLQKQLWEKTEELLKEFEKGRKLWVPPSQR